MYSFNLISFAQTLRWLIAVNYRTMLLWTTGIALITFVVELFLLKDASNPGKLISNTFEISSMFMTIAFAFLASYVTSFINEKRRRLAFLALPATNSEKFLSLITYTSIIWLCAIFLALVAGDSLRMLFCWIKHFYDAPLPDHDADSWYTSTLTQFFWLDSYRPTGPSERFDDWFVTMQYILFLSFISWLHSFYTLGGTVIRKYSFVIVTVLFILCLMTFTKIEREYCFDFFETEFVRTPGTLSLGHIASKEIGVVPYILSVLFPLLTVFNYWASYRTFKGFQVINHKWINL